MIYTNREDRGEYRIYYYKDSSTEHTPVLEYLQQLSLKDKTKILTYIKFLEKRKGYIDEPYARYISSGVRELRVRIRHNNYRIFYSLVDNKKILLLYAFLKKTRRTPRREIQHALNNLKNYKLYKDSVKYEGEE